MKILFVSPRYYPFVGGVEYVVKSVAECLSKRGHDVMVLAGDSNISVPYGEEINTVPVIRWPTWAPNDAYHIPKQLKNLNRILTQPFDIIHTHSVHSVLSIQPLKQKMSMNSEWKLFLTMHNSTFGYTFLRKSIWMLAWKQYIKHYLTSADYIHSTSSLETENIEKNFPVVKDRIKTVPIGIGEDVLKYRWKGETSDYILYSGRLENYKRVDLILQSLAYLVKHGLKFRLIVMGSGAATAKIHKLSKKFFAESADQFLQFSPSKSRKDYLEVLSNARAAVSLSMAENFNIFLAEATAMGVPIIATREAAAFCPSLANVHNLNPVCIASVMSSMFSTGTTNSVNCKFNTWSEMVKQLEQLYISAAVH